MQRSRIKINTKAEKHLPMEPTKERLATEGQGVLLLG